MRGIDLSTSTSQASCAITDGTPYAAASPPRPASRSPTSRWAIATQRVDARQLLDRPQQRAGRDSVGEVRDDLRRLGTQPREIDAHHIAPLHGHVLQPPDRVARAHPPDAGRSRPHARARRARPGTPTARPARRRSPARRPPGQLRGAADHAEDVRVDQEVLAELAVGAYPELPQPAQARLDGARHPARRSHQPNTRAALRSTAAPSSATETPRSSARKATVWATNAGWLRSLRTTWGVR